MRFELDFPVIHDRYHTPQLELTWFAKAFPSLFFYKKIAGVVKRGAHLAKRGRYLDANWCLSSYQSFKAVESIGAKVIVENIDLIKNLNGPGIIIGNHMSTLETFLLPYMICPYKKVTFVIKESLVSYPVFKHIMKSRNPIVVGRSNPKQDFITVLNEGVKRIEEGYSVIVFPQTTRMVQFDRTQFNSIGVKLAKRAGVPVVPLALKTNSWGNGRWLKEFGRIDRNKSVHFKFGTPMEIEGNGKNQHQQVITHIENCLNRWNDKADN